VSNFDIEELERQLAGSGEAGSGPDLTTIRRLGRRRSRVRTAALGGVSLLAVGALGTGVVALHGPGDDGPGVASDLGTPRTELTPLAARALAEIPGAVRLSPGEVSIPAPAAAPEMSSTRAHVLGTPVRLPEHEYYGVTMWSPSHFPDWLYDGTADLEQAEKSGGGYPVGTTDLTGVEVDLGPAYLGCVDAVGRSDFPSGVACAPALLTRDGDTWRYEWGMGTDDFLEPGSAMEVFTFGGHEDGQDTTIGIAGLDGTDVARAEFVSTDGARVEGTVEAGTLVPGDSMFFAEVPGELARVIAYDDAGNVVEDHQVASCSTPVECEVR
jgi:hypothetical protein